MDRIAACFGDVKTTATTTTVEALRHNTSRPENVTSKADRIAPREFRRYRIHATLRKTIREDDRDLRVVIADPAHDGEADPQQTMIIEFPDTNCEPHSALSASPPLRNSHLVGRLVELADPAG